MSITEILERTGQTESTVLREHLILTGLSKLSRYEAECTLFREKYRESMESFRQRLEGKVNQEEFAEEDDLLDWEYAETARKWWREQLEELRHAR